MMNVSSVETATPVRSFHHDSAINVNVDNDNYRYGDGDIDRRPVRNALVAGAMT